MKTSCGFTIIGSSLLLAATQGRSQSFDFDNLYFGANVGPAFQQSVEIQSSPYGTGHEIKFDTGLRAGLTVGYNLTPSFAAEIETGVVWNRIHSILGNSPSDFNSSDDVYEIPTLADFIYKPLHGAFQPYIGVGAGGAATVFDTHDMPPPSSPNFSDTDFTFAYQGEIGFKYSLNENMQVGVAYKFLGTLDHNWSDHGITFKTDGTMTHAVVAAFTWQF